MRLKIVNFQSLRDVDLQIEGLTVLKAPSNTGKTAVVRALYAATHNRFTSNCVTWGEDSATVILKWSDTDKVLRVERSALGASPRVKLGNKKQGYQVFNKMNRDLPREIVEYNRFGYIRLSPSELLNLNFVTQWSEPLVLRFSNKKLVDILSYSKASASAENARKWITDRRLELKGQVEAMQSAVSETKSVLGELQKRLNKLGDGERVEQVLDAYNSLYEQYSLYSSLREAITNRDKAVSQLSKADVINGVASEANKINDLMTKYSDLKFNTIRYNSCKFYATKASKVYEAAKAIDSAKLNSYKALKENLVLRASLLTSGTKAANILKLAESVVFKYHALNSLWDALQQLKSPNLSKANVIVTKLEEHSNLLSRYNSAMSLYTEINEVAAAKESLDAAIEANERRECPICGHRID